MQGALDVSSSAPGYAEQGQADRSEAAATADVYTGLMSGCRISHGTIAQTINYRSAALGDLARRVSPASASSEIQLPRWPHDPCEFAGTDGAVVPDREGRSPEALERWLPQKFRGGAPSSSQTGVIYVPGEGAESRADKYTA